MWAKKFDNIYNRFDTIPSLVGQTDRETEISYQYRAWHAKTLLTGIKYCQHVRLPANSPCSHCEHGEKL